MTYRNPHPFAVALPSCHGMLAPSLERFVAGRWFTGWSPIHLLCLEPSIIVARGATYAYSLAVFGAFPGRNAYPVFEGDPPDGLYRAVWLIAPASGSPPAGIPLSARVSNTFRLERAP